MTNTTGATAVCRTALDALQAKYSAVCLAGYPVSLSEQHHPENGASDPTDGQAKGNDAPPSSGASYEQLLRAMAMHVCNNKPKRQTPLVNIGYAMRVASSLDSVQRFVTFHEHRTNKTAGNEDDGNVDAAADLQIFILGAGMDVTGLWALFKSGSSTGIRVIEVDFPEICQAKKEALKTLNLLQETSPAIAQQSPYIIWCGKKPGQCTFAQTMYSLVGGDLTDDNFTEELFSSILDPDLPTMILSELVLAYLPADPCDRLLRRCAAALNTRNCHNCLLLYEPLGPSLNNLEEQSILEEYKSSYYALFNSKLQRSQSEFTIKADVIEPVMATFFPLGSSTRAVEQRLRMAGFSQAYSATAGTVVSTIRRQSWKAKELYDEHAALALHLSSYAVAVGLSSSPTKDEGSGFSDRSLFHRYMSFRASPSRLFGRPKPIHLKKQNNIAVWLAEIERQDETQVRRLFETTYKDLFEKYPAIRKMVKTALRKDLAVGSSGRQNPAAASTHSSIGEYYNRSGGIFLVCVQFNSNGSDSDGPALRQVMGGIGIRMCTRNEGIARELPADAVCFEIHRLFVDGGARVCGVGTALLEATVERIIQLQSLHKASRTPLLVATTPSVLGAANLFYPSKQFKVHSEVSSGELLMRTYIKTIQ